MSDQNWASLANAGTYSQQNLGVALANSTSITDISPGGNTAGQAFALGGNTLRVGQQYRIGATGIVSTTGTPNLTLGVYYGGIAGTALATTGAVATSSGLSNAIWRMTLDLRVDAVGTSGTIRSIGNASGIAAGVLLLPTTSSSGNAVTVNTGTSNILTIGATWGTASASNSIQVVMFTVEQLN